MRKFRRLFAIMATIAMMCTMVTGFAANTLKIESIEILNDDDSVVKTYTTADTITLTSAQRLKVAVSMNDGEATPADISAQVTLLSYMASEGTDGQTYNDTTIQYVSQEGALADVYDATFIFRPRTSLGLGKYVVKISGEGIAEQLEFNYTVKAPAKYLSITSVDNAAYLDESGDNVSFRIGCTLNDVSIDLPESLTVKVTPAGGTEAVVDSTYYTFTGSTLTILNRYFTAAGTYTVTVAADGYESPATAATVVVTEATQEPSIDEDIKDEVQEALNNVDITANPTIDTESTTTQVALGAPTITVGEDSYNVKYGIIGEAPDEISISGNTITYNSDIATDFATRVQVKASVGNEYDGITKTFYVYFVPGDIGFGNVFAISDADGNDIFAADTEMETFVENVTTYSTDIEVARALALNVVLGRPNEGIAKPEATLDYDGNEEYHLAEYYILRRMLEADTNETVYTPANVNANRNYGN